ncbi:MAG: hypothetical protein M1587_08115 [Thaumarchaeota archaeon]|nr:hypothetical protein [Nitrososphaerota archaeon]
MRKTQATMIALIVGATFAALGILMLYTSTHSCPEPKDCSTVAGVCPYNCPPASFLFLIGSIVSLYGWVFTITGILIATISIMRVKRN